MWRSSPSQETWEFNSSRALVLLMTFAMGAAVGLLACIPMVVKGRLRLNELERKARGAPQSGPGTKPPEPAADQPGGPDAGDKQEPDPSREAGPE